MYICVYIILKRIYKPIFKFFCNSRVMHFNTQFSIQKTFPVFFNTLTLLGRLYVLWIPNEFKSLAEFVLKLYINGWTQLFLNNDFGGGFFYNTLSNISKVKHMPLYTVYSIELNEAGLLKKFSFCSAKFSIFGYGMKY